jgi:YHS domain-containing protein
MEVLMIRDPVCLMTVHPSYAVAMLEFGGRSYYFCSEGCRDKFKARPQAFLDKASGMRLAIGVMGSAGLEQDVSIRNQMNWARPLPGMG